MLVRLCRFYCGESVMTCHALPHAFGVVVVAFGVADLGLGATVWALHNKLTLLSSCSSRSAIFPNSLMHTAFSVFMVLNASPALSSRWLRVSIWAKAAFSDMGCGPLWVVLSALARLSKPMAIMSASLNRSLWSVLNCSLVMGYMFSCSNIIRTAFRKLSSSAKRLALG